MDYLPRRLLLVFVACASSARADGTPTRVDAHSLFGFELQLDGALVWKDSQGHDYVGWPRADAEAILEVFEKRIPLLLRINEDCARVERLARIAQDLQARADMAQDEQAAALQTIADMWRASADAARPTWIERLILSWQLWLVIGLVAGASGAAVVLR